MTSALEGEVWYPMVRIIFFRFYSDKGKEFKNSKI